VRTVRTHIVQESTTMSTRLTSTRSTSTRSTDLRTRTLRTVPVIVLAGSLALAGCGTDDSAGAATPSGSSGTSTVGATGATTELITVSDAWAKTADKGMTAVYATLRNTTDKPMTIVSAKTSASGRSELHEMAMVDGQMVMRPKKGGFVLPAKATHELKPGGDHIMVLDLTKPVKPGQEVGVDLTLDNKTVISFTALAKETSAGEEKYMTEAP
jgi:copper(I)-binding protein